MVHLPLTRIIHRVGEARSLASWCISWLKVLACLGYATLQFMNDRLAAFPKAAEQPADAGRYQDGPQWLLADVLLAGAGDAVGLVLHLLAVFRGCFAPCLASPGQRP